MTSRVAIITADFFEESELLVPFYMLTGLGFHVEIATPDGKPVTGKGGFTGLPVHRDIADITSSELDGLIIPGGFAPDLVRRVPAAIDLVKACNAAELPIGMICHGAWVAVTANILDNRHITTVPVIRPEVEGAGALWSEERVVVDHNLITAQIPTDLHTWITRFASIIEERRQS